MARTFRNKSRKNRTNFRRKFFKNIKTTTYKAIPAIKSGLQTVGTTVKSAAVKSEPVVKQGIASIYNTLASGLRFGANSVTRGVKMFRSKRTQKRHRKR